MGRTTTSPIFFVIFKRVTATPRYLHEHVDVVLPTAQRDPVPLNPTEAMDPRYPIIGTTFRVTEQNLSGLMRRWDSWLNELQPAMFVEMSSALAEERGIAHGDWVILTSPRGAIEARAMVTPRLTPLRVQGRSVHQICLPIHYGYAGEVTGSAANELLPIVSDPNVSMHEGKAFTCQVHKGRLAQPSDVPSAQVHPRPRPEPRPGTERQAQPEGRTT